MNDDDKEMDRLDSEFDALVADNLEAYVKERKPLVEDEPDEPLFRFLD